MPCAGSSRNARRRHALAHQLALQVRRARSRRRRSTRRRPQPAARRGSARGHGGTTVAGCGVKAVGSLLAEVMGPKVDQTFPREGPVPLDPVAQQMLDDFVASGRPNAHLLPVEQARANFEALFEGLRPGEDVFATADHEIPVEGGTITARSYRPTDERRARPGRLLPRRRLAARLARVARHDLPLARQRLGRGGAERRLPAGAGAQVPDRRRRRAGRRRGGRVAHAAELRRRRGPRRRRGRLGGRQPGRGRWRSGRATRAGLRCASSSSSTPSRPPTSRPASTWRTRRTSCTGTRSSGTTSTTSGRPTDGRDPRVSPLLRRRRRTAAGADPVGRVRPAAPAGGAVPRPPARGRRRPSTTALRRHDPRLLRPRVGLPGRRRRAARRRRRPARGARARTAATTRGGDLR